VVRDGAFRGCLTLTSLALNDAGIRTIQPHALGDFKSLETLNLDRNELSVPESLHRLRALTKLKSLSLSGNDLSNVSLVQNSSLLSLAPMTDLETLELESCRLSANSSSAMALFEQNAKLRVLRLGANNLTSLERATFGKQVFLQELHLDRNGFVAVPSEALLYLFNLVTLNMSANSVGELTDSSLDHVESLRTLDLSRNKIRRVTERAFHNVTRLRRLDLSHNALEGFPTISLLPLVELEELRALGNKLQHSPVAVQGLRAVRVIQLGGDAATDPFERLKEMPESRARMYSVRQVAITGTNLSLLSPTDLDLFPSLTWLDLSGNALNRIAPYAFRSLAELQVLDLSRNDIIHLSRERLFGMFALRSLNLSRNHLGSMDVFPPDLSKLTILDVSFNRLRNLARDSLRHLTALVRLDLRGNLLSSIFAELLQPLVSIRAIDLADNQFTALPLAEISHVEDSIESIRFQGRHCTAIL
jgi:Leucine-rich repeat (LRR) protein